MTCDILLRQRFILPLFFLPHHSHFLLPTTHTLPLSMLVSSTVIHAVSWEDWWTYDGISGKYLFWKLIYSKIIGLLCPACVQFEPNKQLRLMLFMHSIRTIFIHSIHYTPEWTRYTSDGADIFAIVSLQRANEYYRNFNCVFQNNLKKCSRSLLSRFTAAECTNLIYSETDLFLIDLLRLSCDAPKCLAAVVLNPFLVLDFIRKISYFNLVVGKCCVDIHPQTRRRLPPSSFTYILSLFGIQFQAYIHSAHCTLIHLDTISIINNNNNKIDARIATLSLSARCSK